MDGVPCPPGEKPRWHAQSHFYMMFDAAGDALTRDVLSQGSRRRSDMISGGNATVYVSDMDRAVDFYVDVLGLELQQRAGNHWAEILAGDSLVIGLHPKSDKAPLPGTKGSISVGFTIDEPIDEVVTQLSGKGVRFHGPVMRDAKGGIALAFFGDPDGNSLYLCEVTRAW